LGYRSTADIAEEIAALKNISAAPDRDGTWHFDVEAALIQADCYRRGELTDSALRALLETLATRKKKNPARAGDRGRRVIARWLLGISHDDPSKSVSGCDP
jgi:hypothetical protein